MKNLLIRNVASFARTVLIAATVSVGVHAVADSTGHSLPSLNDDGWHRWTVDAIDGAPAWCCKSWKNKEVVDAVCNLDEKSYSYGWDDDSSGKTTDSVNIFAQIKKGKVRQVRTFGSTCQVNVSGKIANHGVVNADTSLDWLTNRLSKNSKSMSQSMAAIAVHNVPRAQSILEQSALSSESLKIRKQAIFWMGQVRAQQSYEILVRLMKGDGSSEVREHAVFSVSQSRLADRLDLIEKVAREDRSEKVRGQAWFWIAQSTDRGVKKRIMNGLKDESSRRVQEQAVFALSQLGEDLAIDALIEVIESQTFDRRVRKQAMFWLGQSESDRAVDYLADVLDR